MNIYKGELRSIDAWRDGDDGWTWNDSFRECDVTFNEDQMNDDTLVQWCIDNGYLLSTAVGLVEVYHDGGRLYEIQDKADNQPILAFIGDWESSDE